MPAMFALKERFKRTEWQMLVNEGVTPAEAQQRCVKLVDSMKEKYGSSG